MKVMKFGGGVLRNAEAVKHFGGIVNQLTEATVIIVSAFNKVTAALEEVLNFYVKEDINKAKTKLSEIVRFHSELCRELGCDFSAEKHFRDIETIFQEEYSGKYDYYYDRLVSAGETAAWETLASYLSRKGDRVQARDIREIILTDSVFREASVNWEKSKKNIRAAFAENKVYITQGFIASDAKGNTTTLGREGSDFTASVIAYCLDAERVHFWKEVRGIYNADPQKMRDFVLLPKLSYRESVEQVYYGAKILHPKTIKPLQNKMIPIQVRPFYESGFPGTLITDIPTDSPERYPDVPVYIFKEEQILISLSPKDFSFIAEKNLGYIFALLAKFRIKVNLMENSAISFSVCVDNNKHKIRPFLKQLSKRYNVLHNVGLELVTVRHYRDADIERLISDKQVLLRQFGRRTVRFVIKN